MSQHLALRDEANSLDRIIFTSAFGVVRKWPQESVLCSGMRLDHTDRRVAHLPKIREMPLIVALGLDVPPILAWRCL